jgi:hypothetical protein
MLTSVDLLRERAEISDKRMNSMPEEDLRDFLQKNKDKLSFETREKISRKLLNYAEIRKDALENGLKTKRGKDWNKKDLASLVDISQSEEAKKFSPEDQELLRLLIAKKSSQQARSGRTPKSREERRDAMEKKYFGDSDKRLSEMEQVVNENVGNDIGNNKWRGAEQSNERTAELIATAQQRLDGKIAKKLESDVKTLYLNDKSKNFFKYLNSEIGQKLPVEEKEILEKLANKKSAIEYLMWRAKPVIISSYTRYRKGAKAVADLGELNDLKTKGTKVDPRSPYDWYHTCYECLTRNRTYNKNKAEAVDTKGRVFKNGSSATLEQLLAITYEQASGIEDVSMQKGMLENFDLNNDKVKATPNLMATFMGQFDTWYLRKAGVEANNLVYRTREFKDEETGQIIKKKVLVDPDGRQVSYEGSTEDGETYNRVELEQAKWATGGTPEEDIANTWIDFVRDPFLYQVNSKDAIPSYKKFIQVFKNLKLGKKDPYKEVSLSDEEKEKVDSLISNKEIRDQIIVDLKGHVEDILDQKSALQESTDYILRKFLKLNEDRERYGKEPETYEEFLRVFDKILETTKLKSQNIGVGGSSMWHPLIVSRNFSFPNLQYIDVLYLWLRDKKDHVIDVRYPEDEFRKNPDEIRDPNTLRLARYFTILGVKPYAAKSNINAVLLKYYNNLLVDTPNKQNKLTRAVFSTLNSTYAEKAMALIDKWRKIKPEDINSTPIAKKPSTTRDILKKTSTVELTPEKIAAIKAALKKH